MKFLAVFALLVAAVAADFSGWSLHELSEAIQNPNTDPALLPAMEDALNQLMEQIFAEEPVVSAKSYLFPKLQIGPFILYAIIISQFNKKVLT